MMQYRARAGLQKRLSSSGIRLYWWGNTLSATAAAEGAEWNACEVVVLVPCTARNTITECLVNCYSPPHHKEEGPEMFQG